MAALGIGGGAAAVAATQQHKNKSHHTSESSPLVQPPPQYGPPQPYAAPCAPPPPPAAGALQPSRPTPLPPQMCLGCNSPTSGKLVKCNLNHSFVVCDTCAGNPSGRLAGCPHPEHRGPTAWTNVWNWF
ncbi:MAG: hypothetical protein Q8P67_02775 [archaeon]|nr:hypothetical protein [archaeon]